MKENVYEKAKGLLKKHNLRITHPRVQNLSEYLSNRKPLSIFDFKTKEIFQNWDESSFYRNISKLEEVGLIQNVPSSKDIKFYELSQEGQKHHHHHITCTQCNTVKCLTGCGIDDKLKKMAQDVGFIMKNHSIELTGLCSSCSQK